MKVAAKPIAVVAWFDELDNLNPVRFRIEGEEEEKVTIKVDKVFSRSKEKLAGNHMFVFQCQGIINGTERPFELKYELSTCKWMLFKI